MAEIPAVIGRYQIARELAHGGMGSLYLARDPAIDRLVAIKLLREGFEDESVRERFAREVRATGRLRHPNIVTVFDTGEHGDRPFIAMEYVAGETLASVIHRRAPVSLIEKIIILEEVCDGLRAAHEAGIVHRDIKPANVMLEDATGAVKILDFGIAHAGETGLTNAGEMVGTLNYMAPEQISGAMVDQRTDIYAVGVLAYELLSYQRAFAGNIHEGVLMRVLHGAPQAIESVVPGIDPQLANTVQRAIARQPSDRYADMDQLRQELEAVRTRLIESGAGSVEPVGVAVDADAETVAGQEVPTPLRPRSRRGTGTGRRPVSSIGSRASTPGTTAPVQRRRVVAASVLAVGVLLAAASILYWQLTRSSVSIEPPRPSVEATPPAPPQPTPQTGGTAAQPRASEQQLVPPRGTARTTTKAAPTKNVAQDAPAPQAAAAQPREDSAPQRVQSPAVIPLAPEALPSASVPSPPAPLPPQAKPPAPAVDARGADMAAIRELLRHYEEAYRARDVSAVARVMPSLTQQQLRALERDFANFRSYQVEITVERIAVDGATADVTCRVKRSFVSRTGTGGGNTVSSVFRLRKAGGAWVIASLQ